MSLSKIKKLLQQRNQSKDSIPKIIDDADTKILVEDIVDLLNKAKPKKEELSLWNDVEDFTIFSWTDIFCKEVI